MKKAVAVVSIIFLALSAQPAQAAAKVKVMNASKVSTKTGLVTITVSGLPAEHGIYISQCMGIDKGKTEPSPVIQQKLQNSGFPIFQQTRRWVLHQELETYSQG
ncbi:hypothetical protein EMGBS9_05700 [Actinomycetota bacterium]|nr:hypothetical protein EMGBS9_05700 [Actinomycetota bacterium]